MSSTKTQETKLPQWQEDFIREQILPRGIDIAETEYTPYEGELIAGMTPLQEQALSGFGSLDTGGQTYEQAIGVQQGLSSFAPTAMGAASAGPAATYGGATVAETDAYGGATVAETGAYGGATISPIERARSAQLGEVERMQGVGAVRSARAPGEIGVDTLATTSFDPYLSPYTQNVIELGQQDIERQRQRPPAPSADRVRPCRRAYSPERLCARRAPCPPSNASRHLRRLCNPVSSTLATCSRLAHCRQASR